MRVYLKSGNWVKTKWGQGIIKCFAYYDGNKWKKVIKKKANGAYILYDDTRGYIKRQGIYGYIFGPYYWDPR